MQRQRGEGLDLRIRCDAGLVAVAAELAAHQLSAGSSGRIGAEHLAPSRRASPRHRAPTGRLHRQDARPPAAGGSAPRRGSRRPLRRTAAALDAEALGHRDLHALDVVAVPDRLEERVGETEVHQVLHRLLAEVVVDAEDRRLREDRVQRCGSAPAPRRGRGRTAFRRRPGAFGAARLRPGPRATVRTGWAESRGSAAAARRRRAPAQRWKVAGSL